MQYDWQSNFKSSKLGCLYGGLTMFGAAIIFRLIIENLLGVEKFTFIGYALAVIIGFSVMNHFKSNKDDTDFR